MRRSALVGSVLTLLGACATAPPERPDDLCAVFTENGHWYRHAWRAQDRWDVPIPTLMAFVHQESSYRHDARPPRTRLLGFIPWTRPSSAFGYSQATRATWRAYQDDTGNRGADRDAFRDAIDFIGWYNAGSIRELGLPPDDAYSLYLAYHEGRGGFRRGTWKGKKWLREAASRVARRARAYRGQLAGCEHRLDRDPWWWPF